MSRPRSARSRVTIYRLIPSGSPIAGYVRSKYADRPGFTAVPAEVAGIAGWLVHGHIATSQAKWAPDLASLTGLDSLQLGNQTAAAVLLLPVGDALYAVTYGMGHFLLAYENVDPGFGLRYAARKLNPGELRSVTRHTLDKRAQIDRRSLPAGGDVRSFDLTDLGSVPSKVIGRAVELGDSGKTVTVRCADALNIPLSRTADVLLQDLQEIEQVLQSPVTDPDLELLSRLLPLGDRDPRRRTLNRQLSAALHNGAGSDRLGVAWPWEQADEFSVVDYVVISGPGIPETRAEWLTIDDITALLGKSPGRDPVDMLKQVKVTLHAGEDDGDLVSPAIPLLKWIAFETRDGDKLYFFHDGRWFAMDGEYGEHVHRETDRILSAPGGLTLIPWQDGWDEERYNEEAAKADNRLVLLDRRKIHTDFHRHGIEACDLLGPDDQLIHVKRLRRSGDASHLFSQALVSASTLILDGQARVKFAERVAKHSGGTRTAPELPKQVILAIGRRGKLTADNLFTFSQVTLVRLVQHLESQGVTVRVLTIPAP
jgi:uncharacterized protein (TIGR04141 family)